jgi:hypothetical protein
MGENKTKIQRASRKKAPHRRQNFYPRDRNERMKPQAGGSQEGELIPHLRRLQIQ